MKKLMVILGLTLCSLIAFSGVSYAQFGFGAPAPAPVITTPLGYVPGIGFPVAGQPGSPGYNPPGGPWDPRHPGYSTWMATQGIYSPGTTGHGGPPGPANRIWGETSAGTSIAISQHGWEYSHVVLVARDDYFTDALAGGPLAGAIYHINDSRQAPILLTPPDHLPDEVSGEIGRLGAQTVYLLGGPGAVSLEVEQALRDSASVEEVIRLWGQSAYGTAQAIKTEVDNICDLSEVPRPDTAVITTGENYPDSLVISGPAASQNMPILLVKPFTSEPQPETQAALSGIENTIIVGGPGAVHPDLEGWLNQNGYNVQKRLWGHSEYDTAIDVVTSGDAIFAFDYGTVLVTRGDYFTDALAGGAYSALLGPFPMVLVRPDSIPESTRLWFENNSQSIYNVFFLGGYGAIADDVGIEIEGLVQ